MITAQSLFSNSLWVLGLAGVLATFSYMSWLAGVRRWSWRHVFNTPMFLTPLSVSLLVFCSGMLASGLVSLSPAPWWQSVAWGVLTLLFGVQSVLYTNTGRSRGWDAPIEEQRNHE